MSKPNCCAYTCVKHCTRICSTKFTDCEHRRPCANNCVSNESYCHTHIKGKSSDCAICFDGVHEHGQDTFRIIGCGHLFHKVCLRQWFMMDKQTCPMCRILIPVEDVLLLDSQFIERKDNKTLMMTALSVPLPELGIAITLPVEEVTAITRAAITSVLARIDEILPNVDRTNPAVMRAIASIQDIPSISNSIFNIERIQASLRAARGI
jgi:hypothetical protein